MPRHVVREKRNPEECDLNATEKLLETYEDEHSDEKEPFSYRNWTEILRFPEPSKIYEPGILDEDEFTGDKSEFFKLRGEEPQVDDDGSQNSSSSGVDSPEPKEPYSMWDCYTMVQKMIFWSRIYVLVLQCISSNVFREQFYTDAFYGADARARQYRDFHGEIIVRYLLAGLRRWDAQYFLFLMDTDYISERSLAFFPGYPWIVNFTKICIASYIKHLTGYSAKTWVLSAVFSVVVNLIFFHIAAHLLFFITYQVTRSVRICLIAVSLFVYNPASIFFTAAYSESTFCATTFSGILLGLLSCRMTDLVAKGGSTVFASVFFACALMIRSNGLLNVFFAIWFMMGAMLFEMENPIPGFSSIRARIANIRNKKARVDMILDVNELEEKWRKPRKQFRIGMPGRSTFISLNIVGAFLCLICAIIIPPYAIYSYHTSIEFCSTNSTLARIAQRITRNMQTNEVLAGQPERMRWCRQPLMFGIFPTFYSHIQKKYWDVGLFSYWQFRKIPCFLLALPAVVITLLAIRHALWDVFDNKKYRNIWVLFCKTNHSLPFAIHATVLLIVGMFIINAEVYTRLIFSSSPFLYIYLARWIDEQIGKNDFGARMSDFVNAPTFLPYFTLNAVWRLWQGKLLIIYFLGYFVFGTMAHAAWLPFTHMDEFLKKLILRGESILAEIVRLSRFVANDFKDPSRSKFRKLLLDFKYFEKPNVYEEDLSNDTRLQSVFYATHGPMIVAFELLFNSIADFMQSFQKYAEMEEDNGDGLEELETHCLFACGLVALYVEKFLAAPIRERIFLAIYRRSSTHQKTYEFLVDFLRSQKNSSDPIIRRCSINQRFVRKIVSFLESKNSPSLAPQMYMTLSFEQSIIATGTIQINRIVSAIFREKWVFNMGFGIIVNLFEVWYYQKAAYSALSSVIPSAEAIKVARKHLEVLSSTEIPKSISAMSEFEKYLGISANFNRSLEWLTLHSSRIYGGARGKSITSSMKDVSLDAKLFSWLLEVSSFEMKLLDLFEGNIENRTKQKEMFKKNVVRLLEQLSNFFEHGLVELGPTQKENFKKWIKNVNVAISEMDLNEIEASMDLVQQVRKRVKQVGELLGFGTNFVLKECLLKIDSDLKNLLALLKLDESGLKNVYRKIHADYLWPLFVTIMPNLEQVLLSSKSNKGLREIFTKMATSIYVLEEELNKLVVLKSPKEFDCVKRIATTYSNFLEIQLRAVLQSVPKHLFTVMHNVIAPNLATNQFHGTIEKSELKAISETFLSEKLVEETYTITNMSMGISRMMLTKLGTVPIKPKQLLEDGISRQLDEEVKNVMKNHGATLESHYNTYTKLNSMKESFFYLADFMNLNGFSIWKCSMEDHFAKAAEDREFPLVELVLRVTNPKSTRFTWHDLGWKDARSRKVAMPYDYLRRIGELIHPYPLNALESILLGDLEQLVKDHMKNWRKIGSSLNYTFSLDACETVVTSPEYEKLSKLVTPQAAVLSMQLAQIGQILLILKNIGESKRLINSLRGNCIESEARICNEFLVANPKCLQSNTPALMKMFSYFSIFNPEKLIFQIRDDPHPLLMVSLLQCITPKLQDLCPEMLSIGIRFVLRQAKSYQNNIAFFETMATTISDNLKKTTPECDKLFKNIVDTD
ncbi:unnamed protein product [Caenorhabditis bovis]|uniref:GPI mannosyltransferase 2 n=1 Tax=Caenorhabditis bovis TaxID=2654633 RepID=A0A8S1F0A2_9PELO|nr:unnamed protein product [Caenorhabditis bovis]